MNNRIRLFVLLIVFCLAAGNAFASVIIPSDTETIGEGAFRGDASVTEVDLPEGLLRIEEQAFAYTSLTSVLLPASLQYFAPDAFEGCPEELILWVYPGSDAQELCESYQMPYRVKQSTTGPIGIIMPTASLTRWSRDGELMKSMLESKGYEVQLHYANNKVSDQETAIEAAIETGCRLLIIAPISGSSLTEVLEQAKNNGIPVIAYDRLLLDTDAVSYYVTFDNYGVGVVQGKYVKDALRLDEAQGPFSIEITAGDPGDSNARVFFDGAMSVLEPYIDSGKLIVKSGQTAFADVATDGWRTDNASSRAEDILNTYYSDSRLDAWLCSNDSTATGVINALENSYNGEWPVITGQDCDLANVKWIIAGHQSMSVFKDTGILAAQTVKMACQIANGEEVDVNDTETYDNYVKKVPSFLCVPAYVDISNYREVLIDGGYYSEDMLRP